MGAYFKLVTGIILMAFAIGGAIFSIPNKPSSSFMPMKEVYVIVVVSAVTFLTGYYFVYKALKKIIKNMEGSSH